jgi:arylsulfatase A-like enzyme
MQRRPPHRIVANGRDNGWSRRRFLIAGGAMAGLSCSPGLAPDNAARRPNILFLLPDQLRAQALGCMGNPDVKTPHLDRLASEGLLLRNMFANTPVCCPARATMLTGKYAHANGMVANDLRLRESEISVAELLRDAGYRTGFVGKWHLDGGKRLPGYVPPGPRRQGFEFWAANECSHRHFDTQYFRDSDEPIPIQSFEAETWANLGIEFLRQTQSDDRPFFLAIQMGPPHDPYIAPEQYKAMYDPQALTMRPNWKESPELPGRDDIASYYAMITGVDEQIGRLITTLDELGLAEDTIVWVSSDHGDMLGSQGLRLKRKPWEESIHIPGIVRYPRKVLGARTSDVLLTQVDFAPTWLGLCGVKAPAGMQGTDLSAVVLGESEHGPDSAFFEIFGPYHAGGVTEGWRGVRTARYMYARHQDAPWVLYDLEQDPYELNNLAVDPAAAAVREEMEQRLAEWMKKTGDSWDFNWTHPVEDNGRLYRHETFYTVEEYLAWAKEHPQLDAAP